MEKIIIQVPILPILKVVFFPKSKIPLIIDDPEQKELVIDCLENHKLLGLSLVKENPEIPSEENQKIFKTFTIGKVIDGENAHDGSLSILLEGIERVKIISEVKKCSYKFARVIPICDYIDMKKRTELAEQTKDMLRLAEEFTTIFPNYSKTMKKIISSYPHPGIIADQIGFTLVIDPYSKQCILSETNILRRVQLVCIQMKILINKYSLEKNKDFIL